MAIQDTNLQSNRQHAVPQNIMDVEFKIIGDLTMRQFSYLMVLGLLSYFNTQFMVGIFKWPLTIFFMVLGLALAFIPVQDRGMDVWLVNFIKSVYSPTQRVWRKTIALPSAFLYDSLNVMKQELITLAPTTSRRKLEEYLDYSHKSLPRDPLDIPEDEYILKVRQMNQRNNAIYSQVSNAEYPISNTLVDSVANSITPQPISSFISNEVPVAKIIPTEKQSVSSVVEKTESVAPIKNSQGFGLGSLVSKIESNIGTAIKDITTHTKDIAKEAATIASNIPSSAPKSSPVLQKTATITASNVNGESVNNVPVKSSFTAPIREVRRSNPTIKAQPIQRQMDSPIYSTLTPDRHSGRKFTSFLPEQGELVLPIRGERVLRTTDQMNLEESLEDKTEKLQLLLEQIRQSNVQPVKKTSSNNMASVTEAIATSISDLPPERSSNNSGNNIVNALNPQDYISSVPNKAYEVTAEPLNTKPTNNVNNIINTSKDNIIPNQSSTTVDKVVAEVSKEALDQLSKKRESILNELSALRTSTDSSTTDKISNLQTTLQQVNSQYQQLKKQFQDIAHLSQAQATIKPISTSTISSVPSLNKANILWGFVKSDTGKPLADTVAIIKNVRGEPVRATKTNALGQFTLTTPLNNGKYIVEISANNKAGLSFDIISVEASGNVIPPLDFIGKKIN